MTQPSLNELLKLRKDILNQLSDSMESFIQLFGRLKNDLVCEQEERVQVALTIATLVMDVMDGVMSKMGNIVAKQPDGIH
jgi:hypothetical protein